MSRTTLALPQRPTEKTYVAMPQELWHMLSYKRPHESQTEHDWVMQFIIPLTTHKNTYDHGIDGADNVWVIVGSEEPTSMFTAHVDTVHHTEGTQRLQYKSGMLTLAKDEKGSNCLGADDGAGCYILMQMIRAGTPGLYYFFRGEERGGIGSSWLAEHPTPQLESIERCISFDRKGTNSVITHQGWSRCCSDTFAQALAQMLDYELDDTGLFTDSANMIGLIPECTNLSVGYYNEHHNTEMLDVGFLVWLAKRCTKIDWGALPTQRDPNSRERYGVDDWMGMLEPIQIETLTAHEIMSMDYDELIDIVDMSDPIYIADLIYRLAAQRDQPYYPH